MEFRVERGVLADAVTWAARSLPARSSVPVSLAGSESAAVAFNPDYPLDALGSFTAPAVRFDLLGAGQRALLGEMPPPGQPPEPSAHRHLLMSVRQLG